MELEDKYKEAACRMRKERLPGWEAFLKKSEDARKYIDTREKKIDRALSDGDPILFSEYLGEWLNGWNRVNRVLAEEYRASNEDPTKWEVRYIKWMKIKYIRFGGDKGEFFLFPRKPMSRPKAKHWFTVDEMLDLLYSPAAIEVIKMSDMLPVRPESLKAPEPGEKNLTMDFTKETPLVKYERHGDRNGRKRFR